ncbi:MAG: alginate lyase family protein [Chloroflexota bacterium]
MKALSLSLAFKAIRELGPKQLGLYALYKAMLRLGTFRRNGRAMPGKGPREIVHLLDLPNLARLRECLGRSGLNRLLEEANDIVDGRVRLFGAGPVALDLRQPDDIPYWTAYETSNVHPSDVKFIWEPARFGWAFVLGRAYYLTRDERYPQTFWLQLEEFWDDNPVNRGPNWVSAQEVALRLMAFVFAAQLFARSIYTTPERLARLAASVAAHAERIPPTIFYARAQNNNHLLSEAAGLITASLALPAHPAARRWAALGWRWFNAGLESQIAEDGAYVQHSTNYHRLILQLALWIWQIGKSRPGNFSAQAGQALQRATRWLLDLLDPSSGRVPNLGPNDGAYILPFTVFPFEDYRPVLQAASRAFLMQPAFDTGLWDEMALWFVGASERADVSPLPRSQDVPIVRGENAWAYLRAVRFTSRPGHADQLHVDLWWRGLNVAQDAGTYLYNAHTPWDNRLSSAFVHNTVTIHGQDQMTRAGKFLYLDWAQAEIIDRQVDDLGKLIGLTAQHDGYQRFGLLHQRRVSLQPPDCWLIEDLLLPAAGSRPKTNQPAAAFCLHWLLPDWPYELLLAHNILRLQSPYGWISVGVRAGEAVQSQPYHLSLIRAGKLIYGAGRASPILGWFSPTYGKKQPALSLCFEGKSHPPLRMFTEWRFPTEAG